jgi:hypothetical protein
VAQIGSPLLVVHGSEDRLIPPALGRKLFEAARGPKEFVLVEGGSHHNTNSVGQPQYREAMARLFVSRVQGSKLKAKREIRVATLFRDGPAQFLRMIAVHELAHIREKAHDKAFYSLCTHMEPDYHQLEFDVRLYLTHLDGGGAPLWAGTVTRAPRAFC